MSIEEEARQFIKDKSTQCKNDLKTLIQELKKILDKLDKVL